MMFGARKFIGMAIAVAFTCAILPANVAAVPTPHASCCANAPAADNHCERHAPKPAQNTDCCATCIGALALAPAGDQPLVAPPPDDRIFATVTTEPVSRHERPPVPPPRCAVA